MCIKADAIRGRFARQAGHGHDVAADGDHEACARGQPHESDEAVELASNHMGFGVSRPVTRKVVETTLRFLAERDLPRP